MYLATNGAACIAHYRDEMKRNHPQQEHSLLQRKHNEEKKLTISRYNTCCFAWGRSQTCITANKEVGGETQCYCAPSNYKTLHVTPQRVNYKPADFWQKNVQKKCTLRREAAKIFVPYTERTHRFLGLRNLYTERTHRFWSRYMYTQNARTGAKRQI